MKQTHKKAKIKQTRGDIIYGAIVTGSIIIAGILAIYPVLFVLSASVSNPVEVNSGHVLLFPKGIQWEGYELVFKNQWILKGYRNSLIYTILGTVLNVAATVMAGFALSRKDLYGRKLLNWFIAIPMWFGGGLIPTYLVVNGLRLVNTPIILIILGLVSTYNIIICRTFMDSLPAELQDAARIDGCNDFKTLSHIILPVSAPIIAVLCLYYAVGHWNNYFEAMIYVNNKEWQTLQVFLREILIQNISIDESMQDTEELLRRMELANIMKYSLIVVTSVPMLIAYPFVQKFFVKGVMVGTVKG